ncbi:GTPase-activating protein, putative [Plasmodium ovale]|nr:GTPase-activating protein, putative [Plasmodium ovale]
MNNYEKVKKFATHKEKGHLAGKTVAEPGEGKARNVRNLCDTGGIRIHDNSNDNHHDENCIGWSGEVCNLNLESEKESGEKHEYEEGRGEWGMHDKHVGDAKRKGNLLRGKTELNRKRTQHSIRSNNGNGSKEGERAYLTYCDDGYLRGLLKNAVVSPGVHIFLGTKVISFLNERERDICSLACKLLFFEVHSLTNLKDLYRSKFISNEKRRFIWKSILLAENTYMSEEMYETLGKKNSCYENIIEKDIPRTFPNNVLFLNKEENMQNKLSDVLKICSLYFKRIGYCQGMNYVAAIFLLVFKNKVDTIRCFIALLKNYNLKGMFLCTFPQLKKIMHQLNILIKAYIPKLYHYFRKKKIKIDFFCINWFMTLFSQDLSFENTVKLWDIFFLFGIKILIKLSLAFLYHHQKKILNMSYDEALTFLKTIPKLSFTNYLFDEKNFFPYLRKFKVTNRILRQIILLKKNNEKVEILVKKNDDRVRCSLLLRRKSGDSPSVVKDLSLLEKFMDMLRGETTQTVRMKSGDRIVRTVRSERSEQSERRVRSARNGDGRSVRGSLYNTLPANGSVYPNDLLFDNPCLGLHFSSSLLCGTYEKGWHKKGRQQLHMRAEKGEQNAAAKGSPESATPRKESSKNRTDPFAELNSYADFNLTKPFEL